MRCPILVFVSSLFLLACGSTEDFPAVSTTGDDAGSGGSGGIVLPDGGGGSGASNDGGGGEGLSPTGGHGGEALGGGGSAGDGGENGGGEGGTAGSGGVGGTAGAGGSGGSPEPFCSPGSNQCNGVDVETCNAEGTAWEFTETCPFVCLADSCAGSCIPTTLRCITTAIEKCDAQGEWAYQENCPYLCSDGACTGSCVPTTRQCDGDTVQTCNASGQWVNGQTCQYVCSVGNCTGVCEPGTLTCSLNTPWSCNAQGQWDSGSACPFACVSGSCTGVCVPTTTQCDDLVPQTCNASGQWVSGSACPYVCLSGSCSGVCVPNEMRCSGTSTETCNAQGQWDVAVPCPGATHGNPTCTGNGVCGFTCISGYDDCNGLPGDGCESTLGTDSANCGTCDRTCYGATCSASKCQPQIVATGQTQPYDLALDETNVYWVNIEPCTTYGQGVFRASIADNIPIGIGGVQCEQEIAVNSTYVYWSPASDIEGETIVGGTPAWSGSHVYLSNVRGLNADDSNVYWMDSLDHTVRSNPVGSVGPVILYTDTEQNVNVPTDMTLHGDKLFWLGTMRVRSLPTSGGSPTLIDYDINAVDFGTLAVDDSYVFWSTRFPAQKTKLYRATHAGSGKTILVQSQVNGGRIDGMAVDDTYLYYTEYGSGCDIRRIPREGGTPETIATGCGASSTRRLRANSTFLYWLGADSVMRMVKP